MGFSSDVVIPEKGIVEFTTVVTADARTISSIHTHSSEEILADEPEVFHVGPCGWTRERKKENGRS
jgi:hypothetical protein